MHVHAVVISLLNVKSTPGAETPLINVNRWLRTVALQCLSNGEDGGIETQSGHRSALTLTLYIH